MLALMVFLAGLDLAAVTPRADDAAVLVVPGERLGAFALGMSAAELEQLGATVDDDALALGHLRARLDRQGRVKEVQLWMGFSDKPRLRVGDKVFQLVFLEHTAEELVKLFSGCKRPVRRGEDGLFAVWRCHGVRVEERLADGDPEMLVYVRRR